MMVYVEAMVILFLVKVFRSVLDKLGELDGQLSFSYDCLYSSCESVDES